MSGATIEGAVRIGIFYFEVHECPAHGWSVKDGVARKEGLAITTHGLRALVSTDGWRGAERIIAEVGIPASRYDCLDRGDR